jgi:hypothetical protein
MIGFTSSSLNLDMTRPDPPLEDTATELFELVG